MSELKKCPFCGGEPFYDAVDVLIRIGCKVCGYSRAWKGLITSVPHGDPINKPESACLLYYNKDAKQEAIDAWNKRAANGLRYFVSKSADIDIDRLSDDAVITSKMQEPLIIAMPADEWTKIDPNDPSTLPETNKCVLVHCPARKNTYCAYLNSNKDWLGIGRWDFEKYEKVTHWMPLPEPPKVKI